MPVITHNDRIYALHTDHTTYVCGVDAVGVLRHLYYGASLKRIEDFEALLDNPQFAGQQPWYPTALTPNGGDAVLEEMSSYGCLRNKETSVKLRYADRTRDFRYALSGADIDGERLTLRLKDINYEFEIAIEYTVYPHNDIIKRRLALHNIGEEKVVIERAFSAELALPGDGYSVLNVSGAWAKEQHQCLEPVTGGRKVFESRIGTTGFAHQPYFAVTQRADETSGDVYFGGLIYTGNFTVSAEAVPYHYLNVLIGANDQDMWLELGRGESHTTPAAILGYTNAGFGGMSRLLHKFAYDELMPKARRELELPVLYNSWYATTFDVFDADQMALGERAAKLGVELFVIDDGWFGRRNDDHAGLGDWYVNPDKFPRGLNALADHMHALGMKFGLWIEPEMVNPDSDLYRAHPDWVYRYNKREVVTGRNQYTLDMTNPAVVDYLIETFDKLLTEYHIDYIKWDMNRFMAESPAFDGLDGTVWHQHAAGVMRLAAELRRRHTDVEFEACAGGGARVNYETLSVFDEFWPSDNVDPLERYAIQTGYSYFYPAKYMRAWVTDSDTMPLELRAKCAMCGAFGIGTNLNACSDAELEALKRNIALYKRIRPMVQFGELYRLNSALAGGYLAWQYNLDSRAAVITLVDHMQDGAPAIKLSGLEPDAVYSVEWEDGSKAQLSGAYLMQQGIRATDARDRSGSVVILERVS